MKHLFALFLFVVSMPLLPAAEGASFVVCPRCGGGGAATGTYAGCKDGKALCPGPCLKLEQGPWIPLEVAGHPPTDRWRKFVNPGGGWAAWTQSHIGEKVELVNGIWTNTGRCEKCNGSTRASCPRCKGTAHVSCTTCDGKGKITAEAKARYDADRAKAAKANEIRLKDGTVYQGKIMARGNGRVVIQTNDGKLVKVAETDLAPDSPN